MSELPENSFELIWHEPPWYRSPLKPGRLITRVFGKCLPAFFSNFNSKFLPIVRAPVPEGSGGVFGEERLWTIAPSLRFLEHRCHSHQPGDDALAPFSRNLAVVLDRALKTTRATFPAPQPSSE
ncbi:hypothetical protein AV530_001653 [Patagioenas fasciata monilis]|uniref:Uncharacterized protein n=1 Tax=Patagioenas fasciata monilis TaxID=372326 RepID=A0A1V4KM05_PATFA|nr:hypothetical protein AV530_001653 [Patagioenas fasciata monilis]